MTAHLRSRWAALVQVGASKTLLAEVERLRSQFAKAAQEVYDAWEQDEEGLSDEYGSGGICDAVMGAMAMVAGTVLDNVETYDGAPEGDDHTWLTITRVSDDEDDDGEVVTVDIPARVYEHGAGYDWVKIPNVRIRPSDVYIDKVDVPAWEFRHEWE